jgi:hypothetical protein
MGPSAPESGLGWVMTLDLSPHPARYEPASRLMREHVFGILMSIPF